MAIKFPFFRSQMSSFVLFLVGRVGSTYLTTVLDSHPDIVALSEELRDREKEGVEAQMSWARDFLTLPLLSTHKVRGFNVKPVHITDRDGFKQLLVENNVKVFQMARRNRVKAVISRINGSRLYDKTGMWGLFDANNRLPPLEVDLDQFDEYLKHREMVDQELDDYVASLNLRTMKLYYEDMLKDENKFLQDIFTFLEVAQKPVKGSTLKITSDDLSKEIVNFQELRQRYVNTQYEAMFDEVIIP